MTLPGLIRNMSNTTLTVCSNSNPNGPAHFNGKENLMNLTKRPGLLNSLKGILITGLLLGAAACSTTQQQTTGTPEPSGFLGDYSQLQPGAKGQTNLYYIKPDVN